MRVLIGLGVSLIIAIGAVFSFTSRPVPVFPETRIKSEHFAVGGMALAGKRVVVAGELGHILFSDDEGKSWSEAEVTGARVAEWAGTIRSLIDLAPDGNGDPVILGFTQAGKRMWVQLFNEHRECRLAPDLAPQMMGPLAKMENYAARLALLVHLLREACGEVWHDEVDEQSVAAGWALADYFAAHAERVYPKVHADRGDRRVDQVVAWVRRRGGQCTARDLLTYEVAGVKKAADSVNLMQEVVDRGWAALEKRRASNGRGVTHLVLANA